MSRLIVGDVHFGVNESKPHFKEYVDNSVEFLVGVIEKERPMTVIFLGDLFENRKSLSLPTMQTVMVFLDKLSQFKDINFYFIVGNHDSYYKNTLDLNSPSILIQGENFHIIDKPTYIDDCLLIPWITSENAEEVSNAVKYTDKKYLCGHLELSGFEMVKGIKSAHSQLNPEDLKKFDRVFSGHYHIGSEKDNIIYVGSLHQNDWNDSGDRKRIVVEDSGKLEYYPNPQEYFMKINLNNNDIDLETLKDKEVKIFYSGERTIDIERKIQEIVDISTKAIIYDETASVDVDDSVVENAGKMSIPEIWSEYTEQAYKDQKEELDSVLNDVYMEVVGV